MSLFNGNGMSPADIAAVTGNNNGNGWGFVISNEINRIRTEM